MNLGKLLINQRRSAYKKNKDNILELIEENRDAKLLDLGCDDGEWTTELGKKAKSKDMHGIEIIEKRADAASSLGIKVKISNLNEKLPFKANTFDVIHSNQVIEHLNDTDKFLSESHRVLKKGGYLLVSTENLASWHNIFALILGYIPFSLTNISAKTGALGNPLAPHHEEEFWEAKTWQHQRIFTIKGLEHLLHLHGFNVEKILCSGYYPFGNTLADIDKTHAAFMAIKARKK